MKINYLTVYLLILASSLISLACEKFNDNKIIGTWQLLDYSSTEKIFDQNNSDSSVTEKIQDNSYYSKKCINYTTGDSLEGKGMLNEFKWDFKENGEWIRKFSITTSNKSYLFSSYSKVEEIYISKKESGKWDLNYDENKLTLEVNKITTMKEITSIGYDNTNEIYHDTAYFQGGENIEVYNIDQWEGNLISISLFTKKDQVNSGVYLENEIHYNLLKK